MKRFRFTLETVLRVRKRLEDVRQREYGEAVQTVREIAADFMAAEQQQVQLQDLMKERLDGPLSMEAVRSGLRYKHHLDRVQVNLRQALVKAGEAAEVRRLALVAATQQKKVLERLKEKKWQDYRSEADREEQKALDEIAVIRAGRKGRTVGRAG